MSYPIRELSAFEGQPFELYRFQAAEGIWSLTSGDQERTFAGQPYIPTPMFRTELRKGSEESANTITVTIPRDHALAQLFLGFLPAIPVAITIIRGHEGEDETIVQFTGEVSSAQFGEDCELRCSAEETILRHHVPRVRYQRPCNKVIYSPACSVNRDSFKVTGLVTAINGDVVTVAEFGTKPSGWFTNGYLEWGSFRRMIIRHVGSDVTLIVPLGGLAVDDSVNAYAGCARTYTVCLTKFSNGPNFWGFEWIPKWNPFRGVEW